jgi:hypothetical protein
VASDVAAISGSALGVIIDARGRPLRLPNAPDERQQLLWEWLVALGAESGPLPYATAAPPTTVTVPTPTDNGKIVIEETSAPAVPPAPAPPTAASETATVLDDLARLRQTVEEPKKRGFFRRK